MSLRIEDGMSGGTVRGLLNDALETLDSTKKVNVSGGTPEANKYVSEIAESGHGISVKKETLPEISVSNGAAVTGKYVSEIAKISGHGINVVRADLPASPVLSVSNGTTEPGKYVSGIAVSGHAITVSKGTLSNMNVVELILKSYRAGIVLEAEIVDDTTVIERIGINEDEFEPEGGVEFEEEPGGFGDGGSEPDENGKINVGIEYLDDKKDGDGKNKIFFFPDKEEPLQGTLSVFLEGIMLTPGLHYKLIEGKCIFLENNGIDAESADVLMVTYFTKAG